jgi:hypothetical protein
MSSNELDAKVNTLRELRNLEAEVKAEITVIEDEIKAEMLAKNHQSPVCDCVKGRGTFSLLRNRHMLEIRL